MMEFIQAPVARYSKAKSEHLPRRSDMATRRLQPLKESSAGLTKITTTHTMAIIAVFFVAVGCFYGYVPAI
jgi:hypothetical protein